jgi:hypothetical protein
MLMLKCLRELIRVERRTETEWAEITHTNDTWASLGGFIYC